jgi:hypothetical protein
LSLDRSFFPTILTGSFFVPDDPNRVVLYSRRSNWIVLAFQRSIPDWPCDLVLNDWLVACPALRLQPLGRPMWSVRDTRPFGLISLKGPANARPRPSQEAKLVANEQHRSFSEWGLVPSWKDLVSMSAGPMDGLFLLGGKGKMESEECSGSLRFGCL